MPNSPLLTIITVVLNAKDHIENTILSVINQTYPDIEYIVIDGGSTDGTVEIIEKYRDKITIWKSEPDNGIFDAMNRGIELAKGEWINFMNAGDSFYADDVIEKIFKDKKIQEDFIYGGNRTTFHIGKYVYSKEFPPPDVTAPFWKVFPCHQSCFTRVKMKFNINEPFADYAQLLDFRYKKNLKFKKENIIVSNYLGGGFSSINIFERPYFSTLKKRIDKWRVTSRYINTPEMHFYNLMLVIRSFILVIGLKFLPDRVKYSIFKRFFH